MLDTGDAGDLPAAVAAAPAGPVVLVDRRFVGHRHAIRLTACDSRFDVSAVPGLLAVSAAARPRLAAAVTAAAAVVPAGGGPGAGAADLAAVRAALTAETEVREVDLGPLVADVAATADDRRRLAESVAAVDEEQARLAATVKGRDGFTTTFLVSPYSPYLARWCARRGLTPNQVTLVSLLLSLGAAGLCATGTRAGYVTAAVLFPASFVLDCVDGQLARYTLNFSRVGAWLDATFDRVKEYAVYAGLAAGAARTGDPVWGLAATAMALQTVRHVVDLAFKQASGRDLPGAGDPDDALALSSRLDRLGWTVWARKIVILPIGERWALIALTTALTTPRIVFTVLLTFSALAALYTTAGRVLRSLPVVVRTVESARALAALTDTGPLGRMLGVPFARPRRVPALALAVAGVVPLAAALAVLGATGSRGAAAGLLAAAGWYAALAGGATLRPLTGRLDWLVPPIFRAAEYGTLICVTAALTADALSSTFAVLAIVVYHHYDGVYRLRTNGDVPPYWLVSVTGGQEGRVVLVAFLGLLGAGALQTALPLLALGLALVILAESVHFWTRGDTDVTALHETGETA